MGSNQSMEKSDINENLIPSRSYIENLVQIKHANFLQANSMESKEALLLRKERILKTLKERSLVKPYAIQLLEARAAAKKVSLPASDISNQQGVNILKGEASKPNQVSQWQRQTPTRRVGQNWKVLHRLAARRENQRRKEESSKRTSVVNTIQATKPDDQQMPSASCPLKSLESKSTSTTAMVTTPTPQHPQTAGESKSDLRSSTLPQSKTMQIASPSQSKPVRCSVTTSVSEVKLQPTSSEPDARFQPTALSVSKVDSVSQSLSKVDVRCTTGTVSKAQDRPATPSESKVALPLPTRTESRVQTPRLSAQPPMWPRQSVFTAFSQAPAAAESKSALPPPLPSVSDLLESVRKTWKNRNFDWKKTSMEEKMKYGIYDPVPSTYPASKKTCYNDCCRQPSLVDKPPEIECDSDDDCGSGHIEEVDRLSDQLIEGWDKKKTSEHLLGSEETELSLLTYGETKAVPHRPVPANCPFCGHREHCNQKGAACYES